jgi:large subunit ribosomal protein L22
MKQAKEKKQETAVATSRTAKAISKFIRIGPRKLRLVINTVRYEQPYKAFAILMTFKSKAARITEKVLKTAVANAKVLGLEEDRLYISDIRVDGGPVMKRFIERSMGRGDRILKRTSHLSMILKEGVKKAPSSTSLEAKQAQKETPKAGKAQAAGRKKKTAAAGK